MIAKIERDFMAADLASIDGLLRKLTASDFVMRRNLEERREELLVSLVSAPKDSRDRTLASATIFCGGKPVPGNKGIESEFGSQVIGTFQDIISKVSATRSHATLGQRGPVPDRDESKLHITNIVRGSFGFQFEEIDDPTLLDSGLKESVDEAVKLMVSFDDTEVELTNDAVDEIDNRLLQAIRKFFEIIHDGEATFRIIAGDIDKSYDRTSLERAIERVKVMTIEESDKVFSGKLEGLLPGHRTFEFRSKQDGVLYGRIPKSLTNEEVMLMQHNWLDRESHARMHVKQINRPGTAPLIAYYLLTIST